MKNIRMMKNYIKPEIEIIYLESQQLLAHSIGVNNGTFSDEEMFQKTERRESLWDEYEKGF